MNYLKTLFLISLFTFSLRCLRSTPTHSNSSPSPPSTSILVSQNSDEEIRKRTATLSGLGLICLHKANGEKCSYQNRINDFLKLLDVDFLENHIEEISVVQLKYKVRFYSRTSKMILIHSYLRRRIFGMVPFYGHPIDVRSDLPSQTDEILTLAYEMEQCQLLTSVLELEGKINVWVNLNLLPNTNSILVKSKDELLALRQNLQNIRTNQQRNKIVSEPSRPPLTSSRDKTAIIYNIPLTFGQGGEREYLKGIFFKWGISNLFQSIVTIEQKDATTDRPLLEVSFKSKDDRNKFFDVYKAIRSDKSQLTKLLFDRKLIHVTHKLTPEMAEIEWLAYTMKKTGTIENEFGQYDQVYLQESAGKPFKSIFNKADLSDFNAYLMMRKMLDDTLVALEKQDQQNQSPEDEESRKKTVFIYGLVPFDAKTTPAKLQQIRLMLGMGSDRADFQSSIVKVQDGVDHYAMKQPCVEVVFKDVDEKRNFMKKYYLVVKSKGAKSVSLDGKIIHAVGKLSSRVIQLGKVIDEMIRDKLITKKMVNEDGDKVYVQVRAYPYSEPIFNMEYLRGLRTGLVKLNALLMIREIRKNGVRCTLKYEEGGLFVIVEADNQRYDISQNLQEWPALKAKILAKYKVK